MAIQSTETLLFDFMVLRDPKVVEDGALRRDYIHDDLFPFTGVQTHIGPDNLPGSAVGRLVAEAVLADGVDPVAGLLALKTALLAFTIPVTPVWDLIVIGAPIAPGGTMPTPIPLRELERHATIVEQGQTYLLLDDLSLLGGEPPLPRLVLALEPVLRRAAAFDDAEELRLALASKLEDEATFRTMVFSGGRYADSFIRLRRAAFDALYVLYMMRRWTNVDLSRLMSGLKILHLIEALAVGELVQGALDGSLSGEEDSALAMAAARFPVLADWDRSGLVDGLPFLPDVAAYLRTLVATPVIHPVFARLFNYRRHFNDLKPLGIGDLNIVRQRLVAYEPGEISDIHNVMQGETKLRSHRRLEKTEETSSFSSSSEQEATRDAQSTDRLEVKREAERVIKVDVSGNAGASVTYNNKIVVANVTAGFAAAYSDARTDKSSHNFAREVISKAVDRVVTRTVQQRQVTLLFETEERNEHTLTNTHSNHVSAMYRWVDKRYEARVYNYGRRMMFEFLIPEPAAFLVEQRLLAYQNGLDLPVKPHPAAAETLNLGFGPSDITLAKFNELREVYDLSAFDYPVTNKTVVFASEGGGSFVDQGLPADRWYSRTFRCSPAARGYQVDLIHINGNWINHDHDPPANEMDRNLARLAIDGQIVWNAETNLIYNSFNDQVFGPVNGPYVLTRDQVDLTLSFQDTNSYDLQFSADVSLTTQGLLDWQTKVYAAVRRVEQKVVDDRNQDRVARHETALSRYENRMAEIKAMAIHDLIQGSAEATNRATILRELKRGCLAVLAKEFDADASDDVVSSWETMSTRNVDVRTRRLVIDDADDQPQARFETVTTSAAFPAVMLEEARKKARYVQFLEQAFEWEHLGYVFYPYFWATPPKWVELISRSDDTDPFFGEFLQAGSAKVLIAVTPAYDDAVLHFLATREPWLGGDAPALGDPLYLPLYEELRRAQDDQYGGTPVGEPWTYTVPTSLVYIHGSRDQLPVLTPPTP